MSGGPRRGSTATLGIDVGTTETKAGVVTLDGRLLGLARRGHGGSVDPASGRAEQDPEAWWAGLVATAREAVQAAQDSTPGGVEVVGLAVDGHGPTLTAVDTEGKPVRPAITWQDTRSGEDADALEARTGRHGWALGILPPARWLERHAPEEAQGARWYMNSWEALALRLTGRAAAVAAGAAGPLDADVLRAAGISPDRLPPPLAAGDVIGPLRPEVAGLLGLPAGTPVVAGVVDSYASLHGAAMLRAGDAIDVGGAAGGFGLYWDEAIEANGSFTAPAPLPGLWLIGGAMAATGAAVDWFRNAVLGGRLSTAELLVEAAAVPAGANGLVFLPYLAGERSPLWDPAARGAFAGLTLNHGRAEMVRAILEASAFALRHVAGFILDAGGRVEAMRVCGGPARSDVWNQIKADVTGFPVEVPRILETAVVGSAVLAATGVGAHPDLPSAIRSMVSIERRLEPDPEQRAPYDAGFRSYLDLYPAVSGALGLRSGLVEAIA